VPFSQRLILTYDEAHSKLAFDINLRRYVEGVWWDKSRDKWGAKSKRQGCAGCPLVDPGLTTPGVCNQRLNLTRE
jgi:hypothetical protein